MKSITKVRPTKVEGPPPRRGDPRLGSVIGKALAADTAVAIVGFPCDEGVKRNGGRVGAALAPDAIRAALYKLTPDGEAARPSEALWKRVVDLGDIVMSGELGTDQAALGKVVGDLLDRSIIPIVLGGGHETAFGHFLGYVEAHRKVGILNIDAHLDVRELIDGKGHSGSPFREAREHPSKMCIDYTVLGVEPHSCAAAHLEYVRARGGRCVFRAGVSSAEIDKTIGAVSSPTLLTLDLDAVDESMAPGVSAPCVAGLSADLLLHAAWVGGRNPQVSSFDIVECNPTVDIDNRTARLAALTVWYIVKGIGERFAQTTKPRLGFR